MAYIGYRPRPNARGRVDDLTVLVRKRNWVRTVFLFWLFPIVKRTFWYDMVPTTSLRSSVNELEWKLIQHQEEMRKILADHVVLSDALEREIKEELGSRLYDRVSGECEAFFLDDKVFKERIKPYTERPNEEALFDFLSPKVIRYYKLSRKPVDESNVNGHPMREHRGIVPNEGGTVVGVIPEEFKHLGVHIRDGNRDVDQFVVAKDEKAQAGDKKAQTKKIRSDNPFTTDRWDNQKEWNEWIEQQWKEQHGGGDR